MVGRPIPTLVDGRYRKQLRRVLVSSLAAIAPLVVSVISDGVLTAVQLVGAGLCWSLVPIGTMAIETACVGILVFHFWVMRLRVVSAASLHALCRRGDRFYLTVRRTQRGPGKTRPRAMRRINSPDRKCSVENERSWHLGGTISLQAVHAEHFVVRIAYRRSRAKRKSTARSHLRPGKRGQRSFAMGRGGAGDEAGLLARYPVHGFDRQFA